MSKTSRHNASVKALDAVLLKMKKRYGGNFQIEYDLAVCSESLDKQKKSGNHSWNCEEIKQAYNRIGQHYGATKCCHTLNHNGDEFHYIVIKRACKNCYIFYNEGSGNQLYDEIACWLRYQETPEADFLNPILKFNKARSDKVESTNDKAFENSIIIAQKAEDVGDCEYACRTAEKWNLRDGYIGTDAVTRFQQLASFAQKNHWRDVMYNSGNSGVIFDYAKKCWKAVFIDYAL